MEQDLEKRVAELEKELAGWKSFALWLSEVQASTVELIVHGHSEPDPLHELTRHKAVLRMIAPALNESGKVPFYRYAAALETTGCDRTTAKARLARAIGDLTGFIADIRRRRQGSPARPVMIQ